MNNRTRRGFATGGLQPALPTAMAEIRRVFTPIAVEASRLGLLLRGLRRARPAVLARYHVNHRAGLDCPTAPIATALTGNQGYDFF
jgi:hypothetical protein